MSTDSENTMRVLKSQLPIATHLWCRLGIHRWTVWSEPFQNSGDIFIQRQHKHCVHCNLHREKTF